MDNSNTKKIYIKDKMTYKEMQIKEKQKDSKEKEYNK